MHHDSTIYVAGGDTLLGRALLERLQREGFRNLVGVPPSEPDLTDPHQVELFFREARPEYVFHVAGMSGGILANQTRPAELMLDNLLVGTNVIQQAHRYHVTRLLYVASSCSYPRLAPQPMREDSLLTGPLEPTNDAYALAKLAGWKLCDAFRRQYGSCFITAIPANAFGPHDDFSLQGGHVIPSLMQRMHQARTTGEKEVVVWGSGTPRREFLYIHDLADACLFVMHRYEGPSPINLGGQQDLSIREIATLIADVVGYRGKLRFDTSKPDGMPRKVLDSTRLLAMGWKPSTPLRIALENTYNWFLAHQVREDTVHVCQPV